MNQSPYRSALEEELKTALVEQARDLAIVRLDAEGRVVTWNVGAERVLGYHEGQVLGRSFFRLEFGAPAAAAVAM